jgi:carbonic anhydrase/acetyltransferase-like protein (isoleucine patch superfamily)
MNIIEYKGKIPKIDKTATIFENAVLSGDITVEENVSIWYNASLRGDMDKIIIGAGSNIQDNAVVHTNTNLPTTIGKNCTIGHGAIIHACTIEDNCLIGMGSIILDGAIIKKGSLIGAGALIPPGKIIPEGSLVVGNPMKIVRKLTKSEQIKLTQNKDDYIQLMHDYNTIKKD